MYFSFVTGVSLDNGKRETKKQGQFNRFIHCISVLILTHNLLDSHLEALSRKPTRSRCSFSTWYTYKFTEIIDLYCVLFLKG